MKKIKITIYLLTLGVLVGCSIGGVVLYSKMKKATSLQKQIEEHTRTVENLQDQVKEEMEKEEMKPANGSRFGDTDFGASGPGGEPVKKGHDKG